MKFLCTKWARKVSMLHLVQTCLYIFRSKWYAHQKPKCLVLASHVCLCVDDYSCTQATKWNQQRLCYIQALEVIFLKWLHLSMRNWQCYYSYLAMLVRIMQIDWDMSKSSLQSCVSRVVWLCHRCRMCMRTSAALQSWKWVHKLVLL